MSMLTAQVDRLRETVGHIRDTFVYTDLDGVPRIPPTARDIASQMEEAADTIEDLRGRLTEQTCCIEQDWDCDEPPQARWWRCHGCGERFVYQRGLNPTYCPECGLQRVVE